MYIGRMPKVASGLFWGIIAPQYGEGEARHVRYPPYCLSISTTMPTTLADEVLASKAILLLALKSTLLTR